MFSWEALLDSFSYEFTKLQGKIAGVNHFIAGKYCWRESFHKNNIVENVQALLNYFSKISFNVNLILAEIP